MNRVEELDELRTTAAERLPGATVTPGLAFVDGLMERFWFPELTLEPAISSPEPILDIDWEEKGRAMTVFLAEVIKDAAEYAKLPLTNDELTLAARWLAKRVVGYEPVSPLGEGVMVAAAILHAKGLVP